MTWERVWDVLKWVLAALAAGFVGQFGRSLALRIIRRRRREQETGAAARAGVSAEVEIERVRLDAMIKMEKKKAKAALKRAKKNTASRESD